MLLMKTTNRNVVVQRRHKRTTGTIRKNEYVKGQKTCYLGQGRQGRTHMNDTWAET
jgi:hypothetical protein